MQMWRLLAILAACSPAPAPRAVANDVHGKRLRAAETGGPIELATLSDDGTAALTADAFGDVRLWPALDGSREPLVVHVPAPHALGLVHDRAGDAALAIVDAAGTLTLVTMRGDEQLGKRQLATVGGIATNADELISWLPDGTIFERDATGAVIARSIAPGQLVRVVARGHHALAIVAEPRGTVGYPLERGRFGDATPVLRVDGDGDLALSPDGTHLAGTIGGLLVSIALAGGTITPDPDRPPRLDDVGGCALLGFVDDATLACVRGPDNELFWQTTRGETLRIELVAAHGLRRDLLPGSEPFPPAGLAAADCIVAIDHAGALELRGADGVASYVGYRVPAPGKLRATPHGLAISGQGDGWRLLDDRLAIASALSTEGVDELPDLVAIDARTTLTIDAPVAGRASLHANDDTVFGDVAGYRLAYEPATRLAAVARIGAVGFVRVGDARVSTFATAVDETDRVFLVDPQLAGGRVAVVVHRDRVYALAADELDGTTVSRAADATVAGVVTVDRAGRIYRATSNGIAVGARVLANSRGALTVMPDQTGATIALAGSDWLALDRADGTSIWRVGHIIDEPRPVWRGARLFIATDTGVAEVDVATGSVLRTACGWEFGRFDEPPPSVANVPSLCSQ